MTQLPPSWVEKIFQKLSLCYGRDFLSRWEGQDLAEVQADWGHELAGYHQNPGAIKHALENLPSDKPPTVLQFRDLCRRAPAPVVAALPAPQPDPKRLSDELLRLKSMEVGKVSDSRAWAYKLRDREQAQAKGATGRGALTKFQRDDWRAVIGEEA